MLKKLEVLFFFLAILFLPTQLGRHFWPSFSSVFSLPVDYLSPTIYFWDLLIVLLALVSFKRKPRGLMLTLLLIFLLSQSVSIIFAQNIGAGIVRLEQLSIVGFFGYYLSQQDRKTLWSRLYTPLLIGFTFESLLALAEFLSQGSLGFWILGERTFSVSTPSIAKFNLYNFEFLRPYATFPHPNVLSAYLLISLAILTSEKTTKVSKALVVLGAGVIGLAFSRATWLAGLGWAFKYLWRYKFLLLILFPIIFIRFASAFSYDSLSFLRREDLNSAAWTLFLRHPLFGVGLSNFIPAISLDSSISGPSHFLQPVHNLILLLLSETGLVGLGGFLVLITIPLLNLWKDRRSAQSSLLLGLWVTIGWLGLFDHYFLTLPQGLRLLFLVWGLSMSR